MDVFYEDLYKFRFEVYLIEVGYVLKLLIFIIKSLKKWMKFKKVKILFYLIIILFYFIYDVLGIVLIIGLYNYLF